MSLLVGVGCGLVAHFSLGRLERQTSSRVSGADRLSGGRRARRIVAAAEIAIALVLAVAAGLMVRTFLAVAALPLGYDPSRVIAIGLAPGENWNRRKNELEAAILDRIAALPGVQSAGIGTRPDFHARLQRPVQAFDMVRFEVKTADPHMGWAHLPVEDIHGEGGDEEDAFLRHHRDELGVFVQITAVLDGIYTGLDRRAQAGSPQSVAHHPAAEGVCFVDKCLHLVQIERRILGPVARS